MAQNKTDDRFYSRYFIRRLAAEVALDAYSHVSGVPTMFNKIKVGDSGGFKTVGFYPKGTRALELPRYRGRVRYFLDSFGRPDRTVPCSCERQQNSSVSQALQLNNGQNAQR